MADNGHQHGRYTDSDHIFSEPLDNKVDDGIEHAHIIHHVKNRIENRTELRCWWWCSPRLWHIR